MGIEYESIVDHPLAEVFAWHTRPGAMSRLVPPWQPMTVVAETESLADGKAVLGLPGGLRWVAQHDRDRFDPPHRFVDVLSSAGPRSLPARAIGWWRHTHEFFDAPGGGTRVRDEVDTTIPGAALRPTFVYRHRQLADDLAAHRDAAEAGAKPMVVAVTGASGLVGIRAHGAPDHRRAPGHSAGTSAGAGKGRTAVASRRARTRSAFGGRRRGPSGRRLDRGTIHRGAQGRDPRHPHRADAQAGPGRGRQRRRSRGRSSAPRRSASTDTTAAMRCCARTACAATGSWPMWSPTGRPPPNPPPTRACGRSTCAPGSCRRRRAERCDCCGRCSLPASAAGWAAVGSGCPGSALTTCSTSTTARCTTTRLAGPVNAVGPKPVRNIDYTKTLAGVLHRPALLPVPSFGPRLLLGERGCPRTRRGRPAGGRRRS